jgi:2-oxoglutarate ferredoxin oxidoreductase subunit alpha
LHPFPRNLGDVLTKFNKVLIPELNMGQLGMMIRAEFQVKTTLLNKVQGKPFPVGEVAAKIREVAKS